MFYKKKARELADELDKAWELIGKTDKVCARLRVKLLKCVSTLEKQESEIERLKQERDALIEQRRGLIEHIKKFRVENIKLGGLCETFDHNLKSMCEVLEGSQRDYIELMKEYKDMAAVHNYLAGKVEAYERDERAENRDESVAAEAAQTEAGE